MTPKRHILVQNHVFWRVLRQNSCEHLGCRRSAEPPKMKISRVNVSMREVAHVQKRNPFTSLNEILQDGRYPRHNHLCKFWWQLVMGFGIGGGQILPFLFTLMIVLLTTVLVCDWVLRIYCYAIDCWDDDNYDDSGLEIYLMVDSVYIYVEKIHQHGDANVMEVDMCCQSRWDG